MFGLLMRCLEVFSHYSRFDRSVRSTWQSDSFEAVRYIMSSGGEV